MKTNSLPSNAFSKFIDTANRVHIGTTGNHIEIIVTPYAFAHIAQKYAIAVDVQTQRWIRTQGVYYPVNLDAIHQLTLRGHNDRRQGRQQKPAVKPQHTIVLLTGVNPRQGLTQRQGSSVFSTIRIVYTAEIKENLPRKRLRTRY